jgi:Protein of unknown function (DUF1579)
MFQLLLMLGILVPIAAQVTSAHALQKPQPGPEHQRLEFFVGRWQVEAEDESGGKFKALNTCEWFEGHFQVICRSDVTSPDGSSKELEVLTYDAGSAAYTSYNIGSFGQSAFATGKLEGKTWQWRGEPPTKGKKTRLDFSWTETSADSYTFKVLVSVEGGPPKTVIQGKATRMK